MDFLNTNRRDFTGLQSSQEWPRRARFPSSWGKGFAEGESGRRKCTSDTSRHAAAGSMLPCFNARSDDPARAGSDGSVSRMVERTEATDGAGSFLASAPLPFGAEVAVFQKSESGFLYSQTTDGVSHPRKAQIVFHTHIDGV